ncbi:MAG: MobF family relaxase [Gallionella sp.]|nr:MobF family relaxase [Gallionella sp.]
MLSIKPLGAGDAQGYSDYQEGEAEKNREDYYAGEGDAGQWGGALSEKLGLSGDVQKGELLKMLQGFHPKTGEPLAGNAGDKHKPGWDCTFSAPKSVSVAWALGDMDMQAAINRAQERAAKSGLDYLQQHAFTSRDRGDRQQPITEILAAKYEHGTSREGDPQRHTHVTIANMAVRPDGTVCAVEFDTRHKMAAGAIYRAELAAEMQKLGFTIERDGKDNFRIAGVDSKLCEDFSKRRAQIEAHLAEHGQGSAKASAIAALATRKAKGDVSRAELLEIWRETGKSAGVDADTIRKLSQSMAVGAEPMPSHQDLLRDLTQSASTFTPMQLQAKIAVEAQGKLDAAGIEAYTKALLKDQDLVPLVAINQRQDKRAGVTETRYTSREMLELEQGISDQALARRSETSHHVSIDAAIAARPTMGEEQKKALAHIAAETGGVAVIEGMAGTGKSYLMGAARESWEAGGFNVRGCALAGKAAQGLQEGSGIPSQTAHSLLDDLAAKKISLSAKDVVVIDEAGMVGSRQMANLLNQIHAAGAKAVLIGDSKQLQPIDAGGAFRVLSQKLGHAALTDIRRQRSEADREIVKQLAAGESAQALESIKARGLLTVAADNQTAMRKMVGDWTAARDPGKPGEALMLAGTRAEVFQLNQLARAELNARQQLAAAATVDTSTGKREFAEGDRIIFLQNSKRLGVKNGTLGTVVRLSPDSSGKHRFAVKTDGGEIVRFTLGDPDASKGKEYNAIDHGYAVSVHKSQGATVDNPFVLLGDTMSDREWGYVAASRGREATKFYTTEDTAEQLESLLARSRQKDSTLDYQEEQQKQIEQPTQAEQQKHKKVEQEHELE